MSSNTETKPSANEEQAHSGEQASDQPNEEVATVTKDSSDVTPRSEDKAKSTYTEMAQSAATSATNAAAGVKDNVFSMFGGGAKKEKKEEPVDDAAETSGSAKAKRDAEAADANKEGEGGEVSLQA